MLLRRALCPVMVLFVATGCATSFELKNPLPKRQANDARLAAYEAVADYPKEVEPKELVLTAVIDRDAKVLRVINPTDSAYHGVRVWLNQQHVAWLNEIPPRRVVPIAQDAFACEAGTARLSLTTDNIKMVEMQASGDLYRLHGPAMEPSERDRPKRGFELAIPPPGQKK